MLASVLTAGVGWSAPARAAAPWSAPAALAGCAGEGPVGVAFPDSSPFVASGPGAILFSSGGATCGEGPGGGHAVLSAVGAQDLPGRPVALALSGGGALTGPDSPVGATDGDIVVAGAAGGSAGPGVVAEGRAGDAPSRPYPTGGPAEPVAQTSAYLGDVGIASLRGSGRTRSIVLRVQRHFATAPGPPVTVAPWPGAVGALAVGLDYRTDAIVAWSSGGGLFARWVHADGRLGPLQRLARVASAPAISLTISDDNRAIVTWVDQPVGPDGVRTASVYADISAPGVRFGAGRLIERFRELPGVSLGGAAVRLTRRSRESVMMAWTGMQAGHYVVRAAAVSLAGVGPPATLSAADQDSLLADLAPGPRDEVLAVWSSAPRTTAGLDRAGIEIMAARGPAGGTFGPAEAVAPPGAAGQPAVAIDPATDQALAAWRVGGSRPAIEYAVRAAG